MARLSRLIGILLLSLLVLPLLAADDQDAKKRDDAPKQKDAAKDDDTPKKKDASKAKEPKEKQERVTWGAELVGRIDVGGGSTRDFTLHVTTKIMEPDYGAQIQYAQQRMQLVQQQARIAQARTPQDRSNATLQYYQIGLQMAQTQQRLYRPRDHHYDVKLRFSEKVKIRLYQPPPDYDDKGNPRRYTAKELDKLRGKEGLPGYTGEMDSLKSGQTVKVYLAQKPAAYDAKGKAAKKKDDADDPNTDTSRPEAVMILVLHEPPNQ